jgi:sugar phosphate isomerase/epimerase
MKTSFSIDPKWIGDGNAEKFLAPFQKVGMTALEFILQPLEPDWGANQGLAQHCAAAGFLCYFHAPYKTPYNPQGFSSTRRGEIKELNWPAFDFADSLSKQYGLVPTIVIHGAKGDFPIDELVRDTVQFLEWVLAETSCLRPALELLPHKNMTRVGENRDEVLAVVEQISSDRLGLCWDLGHDVLLGYKDIPTANFLRAVRHVHVHDINSLDKITCLSSMEMFLGEINCGP